MDEEIEKLEIKVAYLEDQNDELNSVVIDLSKEITQLKLELLRLSKKVEELEEESGEARPQRKPPHY